MLGANLTMISMNMEHSIQFIHGYLVQQMGSETASNVLIWNCKLGNTTTGSAERANILTIDSMAKAPGDAKNKQALIVRETIRSETR